jgi:transcriptional regulator with XRE-family HTH domain
MVLLRKERGVKQKDWADQLHVKHSYVMGYEAGRYNPSLALLLVVCDWLQVSLDWIAGRSEVRFKELTYKYKPSQDYDTIFTEINDIAFDRLRLLREEAGHTQSSWSQELSLGLNYIRIREGKVKIIPPLRTIVVICNYTNVSLDWLFGRTEVRELR